MKKFVKLRWKLRLTNDALEAMEKQQATIIVVTDLKAAFDTVNHDILLSVLDKRFGLKGNILKLGRNVFMP